MLEWTIDSRENGGVLITFEGEIIDNVDLQKLTRYGPDVVLDLGGVRRINSHGLLELMGFLEVISGSRPVEAERCSVAIVSQLNMIPLLQDLLQVRSLFAPLECPRCEFEDDLLVELPLPRDALGSPMLPSQTCPGCEQELELAQPRNRYFAFLDS